MQTAQDVQKKIQNLKQAKMASFVVALALLTVGFFEVGIVGRFFVVQAMYNGFVMIGASTIFVVLAGIAKQKLERLERV